MRTDRQEFSKRTCEQAWERANGNCEYCHQPFNGRRPEYQHHLPAALGGGNSLENCRCICVPCHRLVTALKVPPKPTNGNAGVYSIRFADIERAQSAVKPIRDAGGDRDEIEQNQPPPPLDGLRRLHLEARAHLHEAYGLANEIAGIIGLEQNNEDSDGHPVISLLVQIQTKLLGGAGRA